MTQVKPFVIANAGTEVLVKRVAEAPSYCVDKDGNVYSLFKSRGVRKLKIVKDKDGYGLVTLHLPSGKQKVPRVHRLVAQAWIQNPDNKPTVNHINEDKLDNRVANLEWATSKENNHHSLTNVYKGLRGSNNVNATGLTEEDVLDIRMFYDNGIRVKDIKKLYKVAQSTIERIAYRKSWSWL